MSQGVLTWGSVAIAVVGLLLNGWSRLDDKGERYVARYVGMLVAIIFTGAAFFFAVKS